MSTAAKYTRYARWFIAKCAAIGMPYEEFAALAHRLLGLHVPLGTYEMQASYLKDRTPEDMVSVPSSGV